ncbi:MAG: phosphopentomutase [Spirochaetales bacterium]|uniref:Phosphopentomutase n=1 Tax=Candidatus Thalassospirochaeta sargassi TaxID=3119039 RepID=A0AAJ1MK42_9SPIO|nr:phosphopentomutase [Spirochaetales bacterium]
MRATVLVIDSFGIGALPDADKYGDAGSNTALHISENIPGGANWPNLMKLGLGNASMLLGNDLPGCPAVDKPLASWGVMNEASPGKDTTTGHWELAGIILDKAFPVFPAEYPSFPPELIEAFKKETGRDIIGNKAASGTAIIEELGEEHMNTGSPICYTSADSVFQIAAHEDIIPVDELYRICEITRKLCDPYMVGRIIARPFEGSPGNFVRTSRRHDYSIALPGDSILDHLSSNGVKTTAVGKIGDIFNQQGIDKSWPDKGNPACLDRTAELLSKKDDKDEFIFVNLVDTDMIYGHRRDIQGYHDAVKAVDDRLPEFINLMDAGDLLVITADHGCDPSFKGTDHTREHVPLLYYIKGKDGVELGIRESFTDLSLNLTIFFSVEPFKEGNFFAL